MNTYFQADCSFDDNGTEKSVKRMTIIQSSLFSEVENRMIVFHKPYAQFDVDISAIRKTKILGVCIDENVAIEECLEIKGCSSLTYSEDDGGWWLVNVAIITEDNGKEKVNKELWLAPGVNMREANKHVVNTYYVDCSYEYNLVDTKLTKITEVIIDTELIKK